MVSCPRHTLLTRKTAVESRAHEPRTALTRRTLTREQAAPSEGALDNFPHVCLERIMLDTSAPYGTETLEPSTNLPRTFLGPCSSLG